MASRSTGWCTKAAWLSFTEEVSLKDLALTAGVLFLLSLLFTDSPAAQAQAPAANAAAISGQVSAPTGQLAVSAQVRVCPITAQQAPCTPTAQLFTNSALTVQQQNPVATDAYGNYRAFVVAGLYLVQITVAPSGPTYSYYVSAGTSNLGGGSAAPPYSVQFASQTAGQFQSDPTIFINPTQHILETPELFVPGTGTGLIGMGGATSGNTFYQTVDPNTSAWTFTWPTAPPSGSGSNCLTVAPSGVSSIQSCILSGAYLPLTGGTLTGPLIGTSATFASTNSVVNAALDPTSGDIGAKITHAFIACNFGCWVYVPAGSYNFSTQITIPSNTYGNYGLILDPGAALFYSGTGPTADAIYVPIGPTGGEGSAHLIIQGGELIGNSGAASGIHVLPTNGVTIRDMLIEGFSTGDGIRMEGVNSSQIYNNLIENNLVGIHLIPTFCTASYPYTCSGSTSGGAFTPNALHITLNQITDNIHWGVWDDRNSISGGLTGSLNNVLQNNDMELNGSPAGAGWGAVYVMHSTGWVVAGNYFEGSPRRIVLGELGAGSALATIGAVVRDNYFTTQPPITTPPGTMQFNIELQNTNSATIEGNSEQIAPDVGGNNCDINAATGGETKTYLGHNGFFQTGMFGSLTCVAGVASPLVGTGSYAIVNSNYQVVIAYQAFNTAAVTSESIAVQNATAASDCYVTPDNALAATNLASMYVSGYGSGGITLTHAAVANMHVSLWCAFGPYN